ncbi:pentapeptide repeat-containing protein [Roseivirga misakiensis]|uniref:Pentapeptide repeat-containing protein n=1 Tax=Roseivirga misakiensis TaxID=1563681 RepID=A0A1E5T4K8_9BACT|nr:pentapeptide repeat-containing protein [Roseivirga misakiensis]OEK06319.1 hypothetical protein BFP71_01185 [Roseivirga misakiensis]
MRRINQKQFLRIIKGEDLEFRISPFPFKLNEPLIIREAHLPYDLFFQDCKLDSLKFINCKFSGDLKLERTQIKSMTFESCQLHDFKINETDISSLEIKNGCEFKSLAIGDSAIDKIEVTDNPIYELIHLGCGNSIKTCYLLNNGDVSRNSFSTKVFLCPERFDFIEIDGVITDLLHVGTFGEYAQLKFKDIHAEIVLIEGCNSDLSKVNFENISPLDKEASALHFVNTAYDQELFGEKAFRDYSLTKIHHDTVNIEELFS